MNVLFVEFTSAVSGGERSLLELMAALRGDGHEIVLACPHGPLESRARDMGVTVAPIPASLLTFRLRPRRTARALADMAAAAHRLRAVVRDVRPGVVHANSVRAGLIAIPAARRRAPIVVHCRDVLPAGCAGAAVRAVLLAGADRLVANSQYIAADLAGHEWTARRVTVIDNAVDLRRFDPMTLSRDDCRAALQLESAPVLSVIAQITPWKGQDLAIRVLAEVRRRQPGAVLLVVGEAKFVAEATSHDNRAFERSLHRLVDALGLKDHVRFLGERPDPERILAATDVLLVPSTAEPFGRTIIESMAMGVPVVATGAGGPPEILRDRIGGRVVAIRDASVWARAVEDLLDWPERERTAARAEAEARFSRQRHSRAVANLYLEALARTSAPPARASR